MIKKISKYILIIILFIFITGCNVSKNNNDELTDYENDLKVYFINVGQADCSFIMLPNGENILIDAGLDHATSFDESNFPSWNNIVDILTLENIEVIDYVIVTHNHSDHYYYIDEIIKNYTVEGIYVSGSTSTNYTYLKLLETIDEYNVPMYEVYSGQKIIDEASLTFQVLHTLKLNNPEDANICSVITKLTYINKSFLFMGDAGSNKNDGEIVLLKINADIKSDVLKVGHHGSPYASSEDFLKRVRPQYSVITTANITITNHPYKSALDRLKKYSENILQSKNDGTILFVCNGYELNLYTHIGE